VIKKIKTQLFGFTIIEALVVIFVLSVISLSFYSTMSLSGKYIVKSKNDLGAVALAREKMEIVRNLKYDDIGTIGGIPNGTIVEEENISVNNKNYNVKTLVKFDDDPFDGVFPTDTVPNDYKRVKITVSWQEDLGTGNDISLVSRFVPSGLEVAAGDGVLSVNIINSAGEGIPQAEINISNNSISPAVNIDTETDDSGNMMFPGAEESIQKYKIAVSKDDYETVSTVDPAFEIYNPIDTHASVMSGLLNTKVIIIDKVSDFKILSVDSLNNPISNVNFHIKGGRILGTDNEVPANNIYKMDSDNSTNANGEKKFDDSSPGQFALSDIGSVSGYVLLGTDPVSPFTIAPGETREVKIKFADENLDSLLVNVVRNDDSTAIKDAQVRLTNGGGYDETVTTLSDGLAFFPTVGHSLTAGDYTLEVSASGYQNYSGSVEIDKLTTKEIKLIAT